MRMNTCDTNCDRILSPRRNDGIPAFFVVVFCKKNCLSHDENEYKKIYLILYKKI